MSKLGVSYKLLMLLSVALASFASHLCAQGYSIEGNRIVISTKDHWMDWKFPRGVVDIADNGQVSPAYIRKNINASLDAYKFVHDKDIRGGIRDAGSNLGDAPNIIDGDLHTYWEPDYRDTLSSWWVDVDLGRLVLATRIVVRFVEEEQGDPFLGFKIFTSKGDPDPSKRDVFSWMRVGMTEKPNTEGQRVFEFLLKPSMDADEGFTGDVVQYVRILVTDSYGGKAEEISKEEYESLDPDLRGVVEHYKRVSPTEERFIPPDGYEALPPEEKGSIKYYRREIPRLAEVEVWSLGDNISLGILKRGGSVWEPMNKENSIRGFDGSYMTVSQFWGTRPELGREGLVADLGATFWIDAIRIVGPEGYGHWSPGSMKAVLIRGSDGSRTAGGDLMWEMLLEPDRRPLWGRMFYLRGKDLLPHRVRFINVQTIDRMKYRLLSELQLYGEGYVPEVTLVSPFIETGQRTLSSIGWDADTPPGTKIEIRTRTGDKLIRQEKIRYFDSGGNEITERRYNDLPGFAREMRRSIEIVPGEDWSSWSFPYQHPGDVISSPSPRNYLQIQVRLLSDDPKAFASLDAISIFSSIVLAQRITGSIHPHRVDRPGALQKFSFSLHPSFIPSDFGFDTVLIRSPYGVNMKLLGVSLHRGDGTSDNFSSDELETVPTHPDSILIRLPERVISEEVDWVEIRFSSMIFLDNTPFEAFILDTSFPGVFQRVDSEFGDGLVDSRMVVFSSLSRRVIGDVEIYPNPFTPNGDGINDEVVIGFSVFRIGTDKPVEVGLYDLGGRLLRRMVEHREMAGGRYLILWDGRDEEGGVVVPGVYFVRIHTDAESRDAQSETVERTVYVVY